MLLFAILLHQNLNFLVNTLIDQTAKKILSLDDLSSPKNCDYLGLEFEEASLLMIQNYSQHIRLSFKCYICTHLV